MSKTSNKNSQPQQGSGRGRIVGLAILVIVFGGALWARNHFTANAASFGQYMDGVRQMQAGKPQDAVSTWEDLLTKDPAFPDTYVALAAYYTNNGNPQRSLELLQQADSNHVDTPDIKLAVAEAYVRSNDKRGMDAAKEAVKAKPDDYRSHLALSTAYAQVFDSPHTLEQLRQAETIAPNQASLYILGAEYYATANDYQNTEQQARKCVALDPNNAEAWYYIGWAISSDASTDRLAEAADDLKKSIGMNPDSFSSWLQLGDVQWRQRSVVDALTSLEKARALGRKPEPNDRISQQRLQERIKADHLLLEIYHVQGKAKQEAEVRAESEQLAATIQKLLHDHASKTP